MEITVMKIIMKVITAAMSIALKNKMNGMKKIKVKNKNNSNLNHCCLLIYLMRSMVTVDYS